VRHFEHRRREVLPARYAEAVVAGAELGEEERSVVVVEVLERRRKGILGSR
jgi:hypothetical protein